MNISFVWSREQLDRATSPLVYIFRNKQGKALYVGSGACGLDRPLSRTHHRKDIRESCHDIEFICCTTEAEATNLERELIFKLHPQYNQTAVKKMISIRATRRVSHDVNLSLIQNVIANHNKTSRT